MTSEKRDIVMSCQLLSTYFPNYLGVVLLCRIYFYTLQLLLRV